MGSLSLFVEDEKVKEAALGLLPTLIEDSKPVVALAAGGWCETQPVLL